MIEIIPTTVPHDHDALIEAIKTVSLFSRKIHLDIDDGLFTPQLSWPYTEAGVYTDVRIEAPVDVSVGIHLMVREPVQIGIDLIKAGARSMIGHIEVCEDLAAAESMLSAWRTAGCREVGLAILIDTPLRDIDQCVSSCDVVQVMSVATIGAQGAAFDPRAIERVRELRRMHPHATIAVDGGVSESTIAELANAGATRFCVGSAIMQTADPAAAYQQLQGMV